MTSDSDYILASEALSPEQIEALRELDYAVFRFKEEFGREPKLPEDLKLLAIAELQMRSKAH